MEDQIRDLKENFINLFILYYAVDSHFIRTRKKVVDNRQWSDAPLHVFPWIVPYVCLLFTYISLDLQVFLELVSGFIF